MRGEVLYLPILNLDARILWTSRVSYYHFDFTYFYQELFIIQPGQDLLSEEWVLILRLLEGCKIKDRVSAETMEVVCFCFFIT